MRVAEASQHAKKFEEDDGLSLPTLKPQWLKEQRPNGGISNQFRSADQFRGRGGRKFTDDRRVRRPGEGMPKTTSPAPSSDFPPLPPFYRSHSTGSLTPADVPSASSRLLSTKDEKPFSINRECDFPTLATAAAVVEQPARMNKSKSATALPQAISPSSDLLKARYPTLTALAGPPTSLSPMPSTPAVSPDPPPATAGKQTAHKKKPSFSEKVSFSEIAAAEQKATSNRDKFQRAMADSRELQRFRSLVPSKPVHPSLAINRPALRPSRPKPSAAVLKAAPTELVLPPSPATMRKATSAPVLPMSTLPRSPPNPSPLASICNSAHPASSSSSSGSSSHRSASSSSSNSTPSFSPPRPAFMSTSQSARTLPQASLYSAAAPAAAPAKPPSQQQHFPIPRMSFNSSNSSTAPGTASSGGGLTVSPRRRDSSPAAAAASSLSSSPLASPRRSLQQAGGDNNYSLSSSAPLSPRAQSVPSANGGGNYQPSSSACKSSAKKPLRTSGSASSSAASAKPSTPSSGRSRRGSLLSTTAVAPHSATPPESNPSSSSSLGLGLGYAAGSNGSRRGSSCSEGNGSGSGSPSSSSSSSSNSSSGGESEDDSNSESEHSDHDAEVMMIATGMTNLAGFYNLRPQIEGVVEEDEDPLQAAAASAKDEFCPFSWEMRADGEEWSEWSEDAVVSFMKNQLGYEYPGEGNGASGNGEKGLSGDDEDEQGLTEEEIRLAKQQIERGANLQQLLEKKKKGLSESLQKKYPAAAAGSVLASSPSSSSSPVITPTSSSPSSSSATSPSLLHHQPAVSSSSSSASSSTSRRRHQPLRSSSGPAGAAHAGGKRQQQQQQHNHNHNQLQQHLQQLQQEGVEFDSDSDDSEGEEVPGFPGIVLG